MKIQWLVAITLHILVDHHNVVGCRRVLNYMQTPPTHYFLDLVGNRPTWNSCPDHTNVSSTSGCERVGDDTTARCHYG